MATGRKAGHSAGVGASIDDYLRFLDLAADWAFELHTSPDVIERRLFQIGE